MCYHKSNSKTKQQMEERFQVQFFEFEPAPSFHENGFTHSLSPVVTMENHQYFQPQHWGLIPSWTKTADDAKSIRTKTLNAKCETIFELPSFKNSIRSKRCLVPADGFFEWMELNNKKYPHFISMKDNSLFSFGAIYDSWKDLRTGKVFDTYSIITTDANPMMAKIHNIKRRMPLILPREHEALWLDKNASEGELKEIMKPFPEALMLSNTISRAITESGKDSNTFETIKPYKYPELESGFRGDVQMSLF